MIIKYLKQWNKPVGLFLFGVGMIVWGYMANSVDKKETVKSEHTTSKIEDETKTVNSNEEGEPQKMNETSTVIESENKAEESSATQ